MALKYLLWHWNVKSWNGKLVQGLDKSDRVCVIGLGYVGLPLAVAFARHYDTIGIDNNAGRTAELSKNFDRTGEISSDALKKSSLIVTTDQNAGESADFYIVTVPTPIDGENTPDLTLVKSASKSVGQMLKSAVRDGKHPVVVYESTVYPGVTEDICGPILEEISGLRCGVDFFLGYSPERINPGDREHTVDKITKVVSGQNEETLSRVAKLYEKITTGGVHLSKSIKAAEAAKVIENAQRDINIAFINEITRIFKAMDLSVWDVLETAETKWNFLPFSPGLVGGHCIGVDPYYLAHRAEELGLDPQVILAGRGVNDTMANWVADQLNGVLPESSSVLVLGLTFKNDVPDIRNSKVVDLVARLRQHGHEVSLHDPLADPKEAFEFYGLEIISDLNSKQHDLVILTVPHAQYLDLGIEKIKSLNNSGGLLADLTGKFRDVADWTL